MNTIENNKQEINIRWKEVWRPVLVPALDETPMRNQISIDDYVASQQPKEMTAYEKVKQMVAKPTY